MTTTAFGQTIPDADSVVTIGGARSGTSNTLVDELLGNTTFLTGVVESDEATSRFVSIGPLVTGLTYPVVIPHRGGMALRPQETELAYDGALNEGFTVLDADCRALLDGNFVLLHDATVDATTTSTGNANTFRTTDIQNLVVDASSFLAPGSRDTRLMLLAEWFRKYLGRGIFCLETKDASTMASVIALAARLGVPKNQLLLSSFIFSECQVAAAAGYPTCQLVSALTDYSAATLSANGIGYVGANTGLTSGNVAPFTAAGIKVGAWTYNTRADYAALVAAGVSMVWSNDPTWIGGTPGATLTDPFARKLPWPGKVGNTSLADAWSNTADYGFTDNVNNVYSATLQGWLGQIAAATYSIQFQAAIDSVGALGTSRWGSIFVCAATDAVFDDNGSSGTGYHCLFRANGTLDVYSVVNGTATNIGTVSLTAPTLGTKYTYQVDVTSTTISFWRTDTPGSKVTASNTAAGRGPYVWLGARQAAVRYSNVTRS